MTTQAQQANGHDGSDPQLELNAFFGRLIGSALGGVIGKKVGGGTGGTIGRTAGSVIGSILPFEAGPTMPAAPQAPEAISDLEMQGFWSVVRSIGKVAGKAVNTAGQVVNAGHNLGLFEAGPGQPQATAADLPSDLDMQGFWSVVRSIGKVAGKAVNTAGQVVNAGHNLGLFEAGPGQPQAAAADLPSELEMQGFWSVVRSIGKVAGKAVNTAGQVVNAGHNLGLFEAGPGQPQATAADLPSDLEMQGFWSVVRSIGKAAGKAVNTAGKVVNAGHNLGLFEAGPGQPQAAAADAPSELDMQSFFKVVNALGKPGTPFADKLMYIRRPPPKLGLFEAAPTLPQGGAADAPTELDMQSFWSVVRAIGKVADRAVNTAGQVVGTAGRVVDTAGKVMEAGRNLGLFQAQGASPQPGADGIAQALATVQQAMPAIQHLAASLGQPQPAPGRLN